MENSMNIVTMLHSYSPAIQILNVFESGVTMLYNGMVAVIVQNADGCYEVERHTAQNYYILQLRNALVGSDKESEKLRTALDEHGWTENGQTGKFYLFAEMLAFAVGGMVHGINQFDEEM